MNRIREHREKSKLTQLELSIEIGVERSAVAKWETGKTFPSSKTLPRLARLLNCSIDDLYEKEPPPTPAPIVSPDVENDPEWAAKRAWIKERMHKQLFGDGPPRL